MRIEITYQNQTQEIAIPADKNLIGLFCKSKKTETRLLNIFDGYFEDGIAETKKFVLSDDMSVRIKLLSHPKFAELCKDLKYFPNMKMVEFETNGISAQIIL